MSGEEAANSITSVLKFLQDNQGQRIMQQVISARLYGNLVMAGGVSGISTSKLTGAQSALKDRITYNVIASAVDTITAKIAKNKPKPLFLTSGGDYKMQRKAKKLGQFCDGVFYENNAYRLGTLAFRDACVWGDGVVHVFNHYGRVKFERVMSSELYVDEVEAFYGEPRQMHRAKNVDRAVLLEAIPGKRALIGDANSALPDDTGNKPHLSDVVTVRESWHLRSGPEATDGKHLITTDGGVLLEEPYEKDFFPFAVLPWSPRMSGFWAQGLSEQIQNIQLEVNKLLWIIQRSMHLAGSFKIFLENTSKIVKEHLNNDIGAIVTYTGTVPQYVTPPAVQPEIYQHLDKLVMRAFEQAGISMLSAASQKPAGLNSGKALREYNDIESDRFQTVGKAYENFYLDLAKLSISVAKDIAEEEGGYEVKVPGKKFLTTIDWNDVDLAEDEYVMQCYPVSSLPNEPAGRLQTIQEYIQAGFLSPRQGKRLMDFPDLDAVESLQNAEEDWLTEILEKIVDEGVYTPPEPYDDLKLAREMALEFYAQGKCQSLEEERLEMLRRFISQLDVIEQAMQPPPMLAAPGMAPPAGSAGAQAAPMAQPQSDMIPNAPGIPGLQ